MADKTVPLYNTATNQVERVPESVVGEYIRSGSYRFAPGSKVKVLSPTGEAGTIDSAEAADAIQSGFEYEPEDVYTRRKTLEKFDDQDLTAGAVGIARGLSLGLSDQVLTKGFDVEEETLRNLDEANPISSNVGELGGFGVSLFYSGGTSAGAKGIGLGAKVVTGAGKKAAETTAKILASKGVSSKASQSLARKMFERAAISGAEFGAEGAVMEVGHLISEDALGRAELNAENLVGAVGMGTMIGGASGPLFKGVEGLSSLVLKGTGKAAQKVDDLIFDFDKAALKQFGFTKAELKGGKVAGRHTPDEIGTLVREDILPRTEGGESFINAWSAANKANADELATLYRQADEIGLSFGRTVDDVADWDGLAARFRQVAKDNAGRWERGELNTLQRLAKGLEGSRSALKRDSLGESPLVVAQDYLEFLNTKARPGSKLENPTPAQKAIRKEAAQLSEQIELYIKDLGQESGEAGFEKIRRLRKKSSMFQDTRKAIDRAKAGDLKEGLSLGMFDRLNLIMGGMAGGTPGMAASAALKLTDKEGLALARLRVLGKLEERNVQVAETLQKLVDRIASKADQPFRPARLGAVKALTQFSFDPDGPKTREKKESREEALDRLKTDIYRMQNPQVLIDVLEKRTEILSYVAPETTAHTARVFGDAMAFLQSKIPTNVYEGKIVGGVASRWKPSKFELDKFERYVNAVNRPLTVIEQMAEGVLNREGVEVLKFVYPAMFYELQQSVLDTVGRMEEPLPYRTRMLLSNVLSVPLDPSFKPKTAGMLQASFTPPPPPEQRAPAAKSKIKLDDNLATETQNTALNGQFA